MAEAKKKGFNLAEALGSVAVPELGTAAAGREQIEYIDIDRIDDDPNNFYELSSLDELAANIELLGLQQPIRVRPNPENPDRVIIVTGHRRRAAIRQLVDDGRADLREIPCIRERAESSAALQELRLIYANSDTRKLTSAEISKQAERVELLLYQLKEEGYEFPGRMRDHVAEACKVSKSKLSRLKIIRENLLPQLKKLWEKGRMNEAVAYACAQCPADMQKQLIEYSERFQYYTVPESWREGTIKLRIETLECEAKLTCKKGSPNGMCDNTEKRLTKQASGRAGWNDHCRNGWCCAGCPSLAICKAACPRLDDKIQAAKSAQKAQLEKDAAAQAERDRHRVDPITALWKRFAEARQASGLSMAAYLEAVNIHNDGKIEKRYEGFERGEKIKADTGLPYCGGYGFPLYYIEYLRKTAGVLSVSLDYLLCRTDDPAVDGYAAQPDDPCTACKSAHPHCDKCCASCEDGCNSGQICRKADTEKWIHLSYIDGFRTPTKIRQDAVALFRMEKGERPVRMVVTWINGAWHISPDGARIDAECVGWFPLPEEDDHETA